MTKTTHINGSTTNRKGRQSESSNFEQRLAASTAECLADDITSVSGCQLLHKALLNLCQPVEKLRFFGAALVERDRQTRAKLHGCHRPARRVFDEVPHDRF